MRQAHQPHLRQPLGRQPASNERNPRQPATRTDTILHPMQSPAITGPLSTMRRGRGFKPRIPTTSCRSASASCGYAEGSWDSGRSNHSPTSASRRVSAILLYCELTGIQYEERGDDFVSRISSRVEIKRASGGPMLWQRELGDAQDVCRRRRRDYYVNYRLELPKTLGPGSYRLRLLQTDLVAGATTSTDIPLEIIP